MSPFEEQARQQITDTLSEALKNALADALPPAPLSFNVVYTTPLPVNSIQFAASWTYNPIQITTAVCCFCGLMYSKNGVHIHTPYACPGCEPKLGHYTCDGAAALR